MINELIEQIGGRERLESIVYAMGAEPCDSDPILDSVTHGDIGKMARALLSVLNAKPIAYTHHSGQVVTREECCDDKVFSICCKVETPLYTTPPAASVPYALREAVNAIYFNDSSDYLSALWSVVRALSPETADLFARDERAAFERVNANIEHAAAPAPGGDDVKQG